LILVVSLPFTALAVRSLSGHCGACTDCWSQQRSRHCTRLRCNSRGATFKQHPEENDYAGTHALKRANMSLEIQHNKASAVPTWPWRSATARLLPTAVALPLLLTIVQFAVQQAFLKNSGRSWISRSRLTLERHLGPWRWAGSSISVTRSLPAWAAPCRMYPSLVGGTPTYWPMRPHVSSEYAKALN
jgi:hypothetical protein